MLIQSCYSDIACYIKCQHMDYLAILCCNYITWIIYTVYFVILWIPVYVYICNVVFPYNTFRGHSCHSNAILLLWLSLFIIITFLVYCYDLPYLLSWPSLVIVMTCHCPSWHCFPLVFPLPICYYLLLPIITYHGVLHIIL